MDDINTALPNWFEKFYDSGYFWIGFVVMGLLAVILVVVACRFYYQVKELEGYFGDHEKN